MPEHCAECEHLRRGLREQTAEAERVAKKLRESATTFNRSLQEQVGEIRAERDLIRRQRDAANEALEEAEQRAAAWKRRAEKLEGGGG